MLVEFVVDHHRLGMCLMSQYTGCFPNNVSCGLKCMGTLEYVGEPVAAVVTGPRKEWWSRWQFASCRRVHPRVSLEGAWSVATENLSNLSAQQIVDFQTFKSHVDFVHAAGAQDIFYRSSLLT